MSDARRFAELSASLGTYGSDLSKWPSGATVGARETLLRDRDLRSAWERERELDHAMTELRGEIDDTILRSGAAERVRRHVMARVAAGPLAGMRWQRVAAAVLVAGMLGGVMDFMLAGPAGQAQEVAMFDPLYPFDDTDLQ
jgi:hypothetical protein